MIETRGDFYRKKTNGQADTVFSITLCTASVIIRNIQRKQILSDIYANETVACESAPSMTRGEFTITWLLYCCCCCYHQHQHCSHIPSSQAASTPLLLILSTPTPDRVSTLPVPPPPPSSLPASASSLSCSRCSVAIATEKCGNTSVLQRGGWRRGRGEIEAKRKRMGERRRVKRQTEEETRAEEWREDC